MASRKRPAELNIDALRDAVDGLREREEELKRERAALDAERKELDKLKANVNSVSARKRVKLNVGGRSFETTTHTLTRYPNSMLGTMFSGREGVDVATEEDGSVFIDRDGTHFGRILEFLRTGVADAASLGAQERAALERELDFYLLHEPFCRSQPFCRSETGPVLVCTVFQQPCPIYGEKHKHAEAAAKHEADLAKAMKEHSGLEVKTFTWDTKATIGSGGPFAEVLTTVLA